MVYKSDHSLYGSYWDPSGVPHKEIAVLYPITIQDSDGDGVPDSEDKGPNSTLVTPFMSEFTVDEYGCTPWQNFEQILDWYFNKLNLYGRDYGHGPGNGPMVNMRSCRPYAKDEGTLTVGAVDGKIIEVPTVDAGGIICGDYQAAILKFLHYLRTSPDPDKRRLLNGLDYLPVESCGGAHHAVCIYASGGNWRETGIVLDPWYWQKPKIYPITAWDPVPEADPLYEGQYPGTGGTGYPVTFSPKEFRKAWEEDKVQINLRSPVDVLITDNLGRRVGRTPENEFVNEVSDAFFVAHPENETLVWYFILPEDTYQVKITGTDEGTFHLSTKHSEQLIRDYGSNPITGGGEAYTTLDPGNPSAALTLAGGTTVYPSTVEPTKPAADYMMYVVAIIVVVTVAAAAAAVAFAIKKYR